MYNIKVYDKDWNFIQTLRDKEISCEYSFWASINWWYTSLKFEYYWEFKLDHKQRIKIYSWEKSIYQWFITKLTKKADKSGRKQIVNCSWLIGLLAFEINTITTINDNPSNILKELFNNQFDISWIQDYPENLTLDTNAKNKLSLLQEILKNVVDYVLFIDSENKVWFKPYQTKHILTYNSDCFNIELAEESSNYYNKITLKYDWWIYQWEDLESIQSYWTNELYLEETEVKNLSTAKLRVDNLLKEKWIQRNYKVSVNSNYDYYTIKPWDLISVRNTDWIIENKPVKQIQYSKNTAVISLDSYKPIESFIINQK